MSNEADRAGADTGGKHGQARALADKAMQLEAQGDAEGAERLYAEAMRADPDALAAALDEAVTPRMTEAETRPASDREVEEVSRAVQPKSDAPSRAGISGSGSGADSEGT